MKKSLKISVDGRSYNVVVEDLSEVGQSRAEPAPPPRLAVPTPAAAVPVAAPPPAAAPAHPGSEVAPLGGVIISIDVKNGQPVKVGDKIAVIEAMKMMTDVVAKHSGTVTNILVHPSDAVETGQALLTLG